jgi:hypothetical protein
MVPSISFGTKCAASVQECRSASSARFCGRAHRHSLLAALLELETQPQQSRKRGNILPGAASGFLPILLSSIARPLLRSRTHRWSILSAARPGVGDHRGPPHSLLGRGLITAVGLLLRATIIWWALPWGVLAHLLLDTLTGAAGPGWGRGRSPGALGGFCTRDHG